jgi:glutathione S-transferase
MKLYYNPYACSLAVVILATEAGIPLELVEVDIMQDPHTLADGSLYAMINAKNYVPMLELDTGERLTEVAVILQYLADLKPEAGLVPQAGSIERVWQQEALNFIATELHKFYSPWLFHPEVGEIAQDYARGKIAARLAILDLQLSQFEFVAGDSFTAADAYLYVMANWSAFAKVPLAAFPNLRTWFKRMHDRPAVQQAVRLHAGKAAVAA